ncbi:MAG: NADH-quinone oxidoreductase subunit NuoH [Burkholderiales bacterium]|nr:NADH-quinone oxidoreductase subunit NuoH [Anaerolineae bacterium]
MIDIDAFFASFNPDPNLIVQCRDAAGCALWQPIIWAALVLFVFVTGFAYSTLLERRVLALFQHRVGPNRVGPGGFLQPAADGVKLVFKEDIVPAQAYYPVWLIAPVLKTLPTLILVAVIPLGPDLLIPWFDGFWYQVPLSLVDINVAVLWVLAITSIGTYGVVLAGWASNNKYAMLGGLRAASQMISYELSLGLSMVVPILIVGSMSIVDIVNGQANPPILGWFVFQNPLAAAILFVGFLAEVNRSPFDLPEAEQELTQGYMTEYSGMKFALFMMAEYLGMIGTSLVLASLFLGGFHLALVDSAPILGPLVLIGKVVALLVFQIWIRATLPRIRYDRLMTFGWKVMLPLSLLSVMWTAVSLYVGDTFGTSTAYGVAAGIFFLIVVVGSYVYLTRSGQVKLHAADETVVQDEEIEDDPMVTGARGGIGYGLLQILGGVIAIPFLLVGFTIKMLEGVEAMGRTPAEEEALAAEEQAKQLPAQGSGTD